MKPCKISRVESIPGGFRLSITWDNSRKDTVDIGDMVQRFSALAPLRDPAFFSQAQPGEWGEAVSWPGDIELEAASLHRLASEQAGKAFARDEFEAWMTRNGLSYAQAANALALNRRTIINYNMGHTVIPLTVGLACVGWETLNKKAA